MTRSAPPSQSKSQFVGQFLLGGLDVEVYLDGLRGRRLKKCTPRQNPGYAYDPRWLKARLERMSPTQRTLLSMRKT